MMNVHFYSFPFYVLKKSDKQVYIFLSKGYAYALEYMGYVVK